MNIIDAIMQELVYEAATTRRMLERTPMEKGSWTPHPKSMSLARLASHIAEIPAFVPHIIEKEELNWSPENYTPACFDTTDALLATFDEAVAAAQKSMPGTSDFALMQPWRFRSGDRVFFELPRIAVIRSMVISHLIHHRGQLSVYFRINDVPLPSIYGPTADEPIS